MSHKNKFRKNKIFIIKIKKFKSEEYIFAGISTSMQRHHSDVLSDKSFRKYHCDDILWLTYTSSWSSWCFISIIYHQNDGTMMM